METHWAQSLPEAASRLREQTDPIESDQMIEHLGTACPVYLNFAITGMERRSEATRNFGEA